jgi:hypothetical protein
MGRNTGVKLINLKGKTLLQLTKVMKDDVAEVKVMKMETSLKQKQ